MTPSKKISVGIIEDEIIVAEMLKGTIEDLGYTCCWIADSYDSVITELENYRPDLLLVDIKIKGPLDGIDLGLLFNTKYKIPFIFLTANTDAPIIERAKTVNPIAFLPKPVSKNMLYSSIEIAYHNYIQFNATKSDPSPQNVKNEAYIFLKEGYLERRINKHEIMYIQSDANYLIIVMQNKDKVTIREKMEDLLGLLNSDDFIRVHRSYIINKKYLEAIGFEELTVGGKEIPVPRKLWKQVLAAIKN